MDQQFLLMPSPGGYLAALPPAMVEQLHERVSQQLSLGDASGQAAIRALFARSDMIACDSQGRVGLSAALLEYAGIVSKGDVVLVGTLTRFEIWNESAYAANLEGDGMASDQAMNKALKDLGI